MEFINEAVLHAAGQWWIYPLLLVFFFVDGFAMVVPSETLIVALAAYSVHSGQPNLWILGLTALVGAMAGDNMAYMLGRKIGLERFRWMRKPKVQKVFGWAHYELEKRGAVLIFTARYIPWGRVAVNYVAGTTAFPHRRFFFLDGFACLTWVAYSIGIGVLASSFPWLHHNPLLSAGIAVVFAIVLGVLIDHLAAGQVDDRVAQILVGVLVPAELLHDHARLDAQPGRHAGAVDAHSCCSSKGCPALG